MTFEKNNLVENSYSWNADNNKVLTDSFPTRKRFDRFNGDCMLRMINLFNCLVAPLTLTQGQQMEQLIARELPLQADKSEITVFNWLKEKHLQKSDRFV